VVDKGVMVDRVFKDVWVFKEVVSLGHRDVKEFKEGLVCRVRRVEVSLV
jgi:hypothetical protein